MRAFTPLKKATPTLRRSGMPCDANGGLKPPLRNTPIRGQSSLTGFTLIELIVTILILAIMAVSLTHILTEGFRVWWVNKDLIDLRGDARTALNRISLEFRQAYSGTFSSSTDFSFTADIDSDGDLDTVRYYLDTGSLRRQVNGSPSPGNNMCSNITGLTFSFSSPVLNTNITLSLQGNTIKAKNSIEGRNI